MIELAIAIVFTAVCCAGARWAQRREWRIERDDGHDYFPFWREGPR